MKSIHYQCIQGILLPNMSDYIKIKNVSGCQINYTSVTFYVLSCLDCCSTRPSCLPQVKINKLQKFHNCAACLVLRMGKGDHITPALKALHWLPFQQRIYYKTSLFCYKSIHSWLTIPYISDLLAQYTMAHTLCSSSDPIKFHTTHRF